MPLATQRSGTNLFRGILGGHPQIEGFPEIFAENRTNTNSPLDYLGSGAAFPEDSPGIFWSIRHPVPPDNHEPFQTTPQISGGPWSPRIWERG